jgi:hypothetical protein
MSMRTATWAAAIAALVCAGSLQAHHSSSMFDIETPIWVKGSVVHWERKNPHVMVTIEERGEDGRTYRRLVEGPPLYKFDRLGVGPDFLKVGDRVEFCGFALEETVAAQRLYTDPPGVTLQFVHGHVLVMPDGRRRLWGSYGRTEKCLRPGETKESVAW